MAGRSLGLLCKACCRGIAQRVVRSTLTGHMLSSTRASSNLAATLDNELKLEYKALTSLPNITSFETEIKGATAVFSRVVGSQEVKVQLDATSSVQAASDEMDEDQEEEDDQPYYVPVFSVTVKKPSGDCMQFECSFDEYGDYTGSYSEAGNAWNSMRIDSVSVVPSNSKQVESIYSTDCDNLSDELYSGLLDYLKEKGVDESFASDILSFYQAFEHQCYVHNFLEETKKFCSTD